ncbi:hypothetical protein HanIR_Chr17g0900521 [Helianthus annuus]|nr:hypothetical protein HanIR_Chr17g0900521 [Helianthus annuus]
MFLIYFNMQIKMSLCAHELYHMFRYLFDIHALTCLSLSCGSTWLTSSPQPWVELGIATLFHSFVFRLSGLESHHCFIVSLFAFRGLNHIIVSLLMCRFIM